MILALVEVVPKPGKRKEVLDILQSLQGQILLKPGCLGVDLAAGVPDQKILYIEKWDSEKDFCRHIASDDYLRILNALELASSPPTVNFFEVEGERGMELIEQIRSSDEEEED